MKITIEPEEGDKNVDGYPVVLLKVHEFIIVGHASDPAGQRTEFNHLRRYTSDSIALRGLAWGAIDYLREAVAADARTAAQRATREAFDKLNATMREAFDKLNAAADRGSREGRSALTSQQVHDAEEAIRGGDSPN